MTEEEFPEPDVSILAYPRSLFSLPQRGIVYNPSILRCLPNPMWFKQSLLEGNPQFKQVIPQILLFCNSKIAVFQNVKDDSLILGVGDHVHDEDEDYLSGYLRMLSDALEIKSVSVPDGRFIGILNDDTHPFGRCHVGMIHAIHYPMINPKDPKVVAKASVMKMAGFYDLDSLLVNKEKFDAWSQLYIEHFETLKIPQLGMPL